MRLEPIPDLAQRLRSNIPARRLVAEPHDEAPDAGVIFEHLDHRSLRYVSSMTRHYREEDFLFLAEVDRGPPYKLRTDPDLGFGLC